MAAEECDLCRFEPAVAVLGSVAVVVDAVVRCLAVAVVGEVAVVDAVVGCLAVAARGEAAVHHFRNHYSMCNLQRSDAFAADPAFYLHLPAR